MNPKLLALLDRLTDPVPGLISQASELADSIASGIALVDSKLGDKAPIGLSVALMDADELAETIGELRRELERRA